MEPTTKNELPAYRFESNKTWAVTGDEDNGFIEFDLVLQRRKGVDERYMSIQLNGFSMKEGTNEAVASNANMMIINKEQFEKLKTFFSQFKWED